MGKGLTSIGDLNFETAAYTARYIMKKITGKNSDYHYYSEDLYKTGLIRNKEYTTMSRRPGIAAQWFDKYKNDAYPSDFIIIRGKKCRIPKFYDNLLSKQYPYEHDDIKERRIRNALKHANNQTYERLSVKEKLKLLKLKLLKRNLENDNENLHSI